MDLVGNRYGDLTVIKQVGKASDGHLLWLCLCDCGNETTVSQNHLRRKIGGTKRCAECGKKSSAEKNKIHGDFGTRLYSIYYGMLDRVNNTNSCNYARYGARGITVCKEWVESYLAFKKWAILNGYSEELSIDRIDVNGNYTPQNCRWATPKMQGNNRRDCRYITIDGETKTITEWGECVGLSATAIRNRINKGYSNRDAIFTPYRQAKAVNSMEGGE